MNGSGIARTDGRSGRAAGVDPGTHVVLGTGAVGLAVGRELLARDVAGVRFVSRSGAIPDAALAAAPRVEAHAADVADAARAVAACRGAATVTFAAAPPYHRWPESFPALHEGAIRGAAAAGAVLVAVENLYGYGTAGTLVEDAPLAATGRKGRVRARMSERLFAAHAAGRVRAVAGRASDLFGPGVRVSALGERVWPRLLAGKAIDWLGDPDLPHTFTYLPDFARALVRLGAEPDAWGSAWHVPSPTVRSVREVLTHATTLAGMPAPRLRRTSKALLRAVGLFVPAAGETLETAYQFEASFVADASRYANAFDDRTTPWDETLRATLRFWEEVGPRVTPRRGARSVRERATGPRA